MDLRPLTMIDDMVEIIKDEYHIDVKTKNRSSMYVIPRAALFNACRGYYSATTIGQYFGHNHATILHHCKNHKALMRLPDYQQYYARLQEVTEKYDKAAKERRMTLENENAMLTREVKALRKKLKQYAEKIDTQE